MDVPHQAQQPDLNVYAIPIEAVPSDDRTGKVVDPSAFTMGEWSHSLLEISPCPDVTDLKYALCPCFVLAQIESRIGKASYESALCFHLGTISVLFALVFFFLIWVLVVDAAGTDSSSQLTIIWAIAIAIIGIGLAFASTCSIVDTRKQIRKRFQIPEGPLSDCYVMRRRNMRGMRQMALHLKMDQAGIFDRVATLPPYEK